MGLAMDELVYLHGYQKRQEHIHITQGSFRVNKSAGDSFSLVQLDAQRLFTPKTGEIDYA